MVYFFKRLKLNPLGGAVPTAVPSLATPTGLPSLSTPSVPVTSTLPTIGAVPSYTPSPLTTPAMPSGNKVIIFLI